MDSIESYLLNVFAGKLIAHAAVLLSAYVAGPVVQTIAAKVGITVAIDPVKLQAELMVLFLSAYKWFEARRMANPNSPAVQTDPTLMASTSVAVSSYGNPQVPPKP